MNKNIITLLGGTFIALSFSACGSSSSSASGEYDLKDFFAPSTNDTQVVKKYTGTTSTATAASLDSEVRYQYTIESEKKYTLTKDSQTYSVEMDSSKYKISSTVGDVTSTESYPRKLDVGDSFTIQNKEYDYDTLTEDKEITCLADAFLDSKTFTVADQSQTFKNVLQITCTLTTEVEGKIDAVTDYTKKDSYTSYYAKGIGEVYSYNKDCLDASSKAQDDATSCPGGETYKWDIVVNYTATPAE